MVAIKDASSTERIYRDLTAEAAGTPPLGPPCHPLARG